MNKKRFVIISFAFIIFLLTLSIIFASDNNQNGKTSFGKWLKEIWGKISGKFIDQRSLEICLDIDQDGYFINVNECLKGPYDCNDSNPNIKPGNTNTFCDCETTNNPAQGSTESCGNNIDEDCSGADLVCGGASTTCIDADGDGYGTGTNLIDCTGSTTIIDCDDRVNGADGIAGNADDGAGIHPGAAEICDGKDNNCDTKIDSLDNGYNLILADTEAGESCIDSEVVKEFWCENNQSKNGVKECKDFAGVNTFCYQGACASCVDTDIPNVNFTSYGETYNLPRINNHAKDSCKNSTHLNESFCSGNNVAFQIKDCAQLGNAYSCQNGACYCRPNYVIDTCNPDDTALFRDASSCGASDYTADYDCNGDGLIGRPSCAGMENKNVGIGGYLLNASKNYTNAGISLVELAQSGGGGVDFNWNFSVGATPLDFCDIKVEVAKPSDDFGYTIVKNVSAKNKTLWVERLNKTSGAVCLKDVPGIASINELSNKCNGAGEVLVSCPGKNSTYNCKIVYDTPLSNSSWFQVWPLNHSAVKEITFLASARAVSGACSENWNCTNWTNIVEQCGTKTCNDLNNCGTNFTKPDEAVSCISQGAEECIPAWDCSDFGKCADGIKERVCTDSKGCGDDTTKPSETSECIKGISPLIIALIVVGLILIIFLIWYFARKKDEKDYSEGTPSYTTHPSPPRSPPVQTNVYVPRPQYAPRQ